MLSLGDKKYSEFSFTVLMSVYARDDPSLFTRAVDSVFANDLLPAEMVLVVDGPIGIELEGAIGILMRQYNLNCQRLSDNSGLALALNYGLSFVKTQWVARADADDINLSNRFSLQIGRLQEGFDIVGSSIQEVDASGHVLGFRKVPCEHSEIIAFMAKRNPFNHMTVMFRTRLARECGGYPLLYLREDYGLWAAMIGRGARASNLGQILVLATAGRSMLLRRRGISSALAEVALQQYLWRCGTKSFLDAVLHGAIRGAALLLPVALLKIVYKYFLRK